VTAVSRELFIRSADAFVLAFNVGVRSSFLDLHAIWDELRRHVHPLTQAPPHGNVFPSSPRRLSGLSGLSV
jgi:hypothetical protein